LTERATKRKNEVGLVVRPTW